MHLFIVVVAVCGVCVRERVKERKKERKKEQKRVKKVSLCSEPSSPSSLTFYYEQKL